MKIKKWLQRQFTLKSLNKKILLLSKLIALSVILIYLLSVSWFTEYHVGTGFILILAMILMFSLDYLLNKIIVIPISHLENIANKMSELDFSEYSNLTTGDEFERLGNNLNIMADRLQNAMSQLENSNKQLELEVNRKENLLEERKELVDQLAHAMKTPLGVIKSYAEGVSDSNEEQQSQTYIETIIDASDELTDLIVTLLDLSAMESQTVEFNREEFDFVELVETSMGQLLIDIPNDDIKINYVLPENKITVISDKIRLKQVIENLILNAKNHVNIGGTVSIEIYDNRDSVNFLVFNTGEHIPLDVGNKIWKKFYKMKKDHNNSGNGLGLAIVAKILTIEGFTYGYKNRQNGVEFYFCIPK